MYKCKCIKEFDNIQMKFNKNFFYDFEYIPPMAQYPPSFRVYHDINGFKSFTCLEFKQYFQKY